MEKCVMKILNSTLFPGLRDPFHQIFIALQSIQTLKAEHDGTYNMRAMFNSKCFLKRGTGVGMLWNLVKNTCREWFPWDCIRLPCTVLVCLSSSPWALWQRVRWDRGTATQQNPGSLWGPWSPRPGYRLGRYQPGRERGWIDRRKQTG